MNKKASIRTKEKVSISSSDTILARLEKFQVIQRPSLRTFFGLTPVLLFMLVLADWLIGAGTFSRDTFRMTNVITVAFVLAAIQILFTRLPKVLETIWRRDLIVAQPDQAGSNPFLGYINQFESALNSKYEWSVALICAFVGLFATYPFRYFVEAKRFPFDFSQMLIYYFGSQAAIIAPVLGLAIGILVWRVGMIAYFIGLIGERFELKIQINHPDQCGGFKPVGDLTLNIAIIILIPSIFLAIWGFVTTFFDNPSLQLYTTLWGGLYRQLLVVLGVLALFVFIQPLYKIHLRMEKYAQKINGELDGLGLKIETLSYELRSQANELNSQQGEEKLQAIEFMKKVYEENSHVPVWPFDWKTIFQFTSAQVLPLLSLIGTSNPIIEVVKRLLDSAH